MFRRIPSRARFAGPVGRAALAGAIALACGGRSAEPAPPRATGPDATTEEHADLPPAAAADVAATVVALPPEPDDGGAADGELPNDNPAAEVPAPPAEPPIAWPSTEVAAPAGTPPTLEALAAALHSATTAEACYDAENDPDGCISDNCASQDGTRGETAAVRACVRRSLAAARRGRAAARSGGLPVGAARLGSPVAAYGAWLVANVRGCASVLGPSRPEGPELHLTAAVVKDDGVVEVLGDVVLPHEPDDDGWLDDYRILLDDFDLDGRSEAAVFYGYDALWGVCGFQSGVGDMFAYAAIVQLHPVLRIGWSMLTLDQCWEGCLETARGRFRLNDHDHDGRPDVIEVTERIHTSYTPGAYLDVAEETETWTRRIHLYDPAADTWVLDSETPIDGEVGRNARGEIDAWWTERFGAPPDWR